MDVRRNIVIDKKLDDRFRKRISSLNGYLEKGDLSKAHSEAIKLWLEKTKKG